MYTPLSSGKLHKDAILPQSPTIRAAYRGDKDSTLLSYYRFEPLSPSSGISILDYSFDTPENRVPYKMSYCWPDKNGLLHYGYLEDGIAKAFSSETPTRFFDLTDVFDSRDSLDSSLFVVAELPYLVAGGANFESSLVKLMLETGESVSTPYMLSHSSEGQNKYRVKIYSKDSCSLNQPIWAEYRAVINNSFVWVKEPLQFRSVISDSVLNLSGSKYNIQKAKLQSGYEVKVTGDTQEVSYGTAFLWRVKGKKSSKDVCTGWFSDWVSLEDGTKVLEASTLLSILQKEHPGATTPSLESTKLWGGNLVVQANGSNYPTATTNTSSVPSTIPNGYDLVETPHRGEVFINTFKETLSGDISWEVQATGRRFGSDPNDGHSGKGGGIWQVKSFRRGKHVPSDDRSVADWSHTSTREGSKAGGLPLYYQNRPPNYFYITAEINVWVPHGGSITPRVANDDDVVIYVNNNSVYSRRGTRSFRLTLFWYELIYRYYDAKLPLQAGWNKILVKVVDQGRNELLGGACSLDWNKALHRLLQDEYGDKFWIGTGDKPLEEPWIDSQSGTVHMNFGDPALTINPTQYGWPNFNTSFVSLEASGFPLLSVKKRPTFGQDGSFTLQITGPKWDAIGDTIATPTTLTPEMKEVRLKSFAEILDEIIIPSGTDEDLFYIEAEASIPEISLRFASGSRYFTSEGGSARISLKDLRQYAGTGWLIVWTKVPNRIASKRFAYRTEDSSKIFVLPSDSHRVEEGALTPWGIRVRPGRFQRRVSIPEDISSQRYIDLSNSGALFEQGSIVWTYEVPEYEKLDFSPAAPYKKVHAKIKDFDGQDRIVLPHKKLSPMHGNYISGIESDLIEWLSSSSGEFKLKSPIISPNSTKLSYYAREDSYPYYGYRWGGSFISLDLNPSKYHTYTADSNGNILGHLSIPTDAMRSWPSMNLLSTPVTIYLLPTKAEKITTTKQSFKYQENFASNVLASNSTGVQISQGTLTFSSGSNSGTAYLNTVSTPFAFSHIRFAEADEDIDTGNSIRYEVHNGSTWVTIQRGQYLSYPDKTSQIRIRAILARSSGSAKINNIVFEVENFSTTKILIDEWDDSIFHTTLSPSELESDPLAVPLATVHVGAHISPSDVVLEDARRRGGGLRENIPMPPAEETEGFWDIGYWDGKAHLENGVVVVELPAHILKEYGGALTHDDVNAKINKHLAFGNLAIIRYKGDDGSWISLQK